MDVESQYFCTWLGVDITSISQPNKLPIKCCCIKTKHIHLLLWRLSGPPCDQSLLGHLKTGKLSAGMDSSERWCFFVHHLGELTL